MDNRDGRLGKQALKGVCRIVDILSKEHPELRGALEPFETDKTLLDQFEGACAEAEECDSPADAGPWLAVACASLLWYVANQAEVIGQVTPGLEE